MSEAKVKSFLQTFVKNKKELKFWNQKRSYDSLRHHHNCGFQWKKSVTIAKDVKKHLWCWRSGKVNFAKVKCFFQTFVKNKNELKLWNQKRSFCSSRHHHDCGFRWKKSATYWCCKKVFFFDTDALEKLTSLRSIFSLV